MRHSDTIAKLAPALVKALAEIEGPTKDSQNPHLKNRYASLGNVIEASKEILAKHGLTVVQFPGGMAGQVMTLDTIILHESGEWISGDEPFGVAVSKADPQGVGSALTYARRYGQMAALNMTAQDDDAEGAMQRQPPRAQPARASREPTATQDAPKTITLADRAAALTKALNAATGDRDKLRKTYERAAGLCADLDMKDPERLVEINKLYERLFNATEEVFA